MRKFLHLLGKSKKIYESNYLKSTKQILNSMLIKKKVFFNFFSLLSKAFLLKHLLKWHIELQNVKKTHIIAQELILPAAIDFI